MNGDEVAAWADSVSAIAVALANVPAPGPWAARGACRSSDPSVFFPRRGASLRGPKEMCGRCAVQRECASYALAHPALKGVWGGMSEAERRRMRKAAAALAAAALPDEDAELVCSMRAPRGTLYRTLEAISAHPGEWTPVRRYASPASASACASRLRCGRARAPAGVWEFEGRSNHEGGSDLYARLVEPPAQTLGHAS